MNGPFHKPKVSISICTYNRAHLLPNAIESVLNQSYKDFELVIIDNGSSDATPEILEHYKADPRVRIFTVPENLGCAGGHNYGMDVVQGEWFGAIGDDDLLLDDALESIMHVPGHIDPEVNAVTANCLLSSNGEFAGKGLDHDQYLNLETIISKCSGEFWGLFKHELLGSRRFNEDLPGNEVALWYQIDAIAKRYYIHRPVRIFCDQGETLTNQNKKINLPRKIQIYKALLQEDFYWKAFKKYQIKRFRMKCLKGWFFLRLNEDKTRAKAYKKMLLDSHPGPIPQLAMKLLSLFGKKGLENILGIASYLK
ncbi:MAG: glycosyltransferase family 2 protein [Aurantibacter sp.]